MLSSDSLAPDQKFISDVQVPFYLPDCQYQVKTTQFTQDYLNASMNFLRTPTSNNLSPMIALSPGNPNVTPLSTGRSYNTQTLETTPSRIGTPKAPKVDKNSKGLRHFSMKVLQKVQERGKTTYNEVADELVREFGAKNDNLNQPSYDHKNIRRRVYDALNVLMAMKIIHKEKKEIIWVGLPTNSVQECIQLENKRNQMITSLNTKINLFRNLVLQEISLRNLIDENKKKSLHRGSEDKCKIQLPFAAIVTASNATVDCTVTVPRDHFNFTFDSEYQVYDESDVLRRLGYSNELDSGRCPREKIEQCQSILPRSLHPYVQAIGCCTAEELSELLLSLRYCLIHEPSCERGVSINSPFITKLTQFCNEKIQQNASGEYTKNVQFLYSSSANGIPRQNLFMNSFTGRMPEEHYLH
ncbi:hypothetical protein MXB_1927 [Myxobolus squamalis]|nr:hypothetical protein MXB_1927 [Myxobolus squamalis]